MKKIILLSALFVSLITSGQCTLTLSGTTITQTGTCDTASFLAEIASNGANVSTYGNTTHSTFYTVDFGNNSLYVDGDLDIDFNRMTFIFTGTDATQRLYSRSGSLKLRSSQTENGFTFNPEVGTVIFAIENNTVNWASQTLRVDNTGGKSEFNGVTFKGEFSAWIYGNARFENCVMEKIGNDGDIQFNVQGTTELVDIKKYDSGQTGITFRGDSRNVLIDNVRVFGARDSFNNESSFSVTIEKLDSDTGAVADISQFGGRHYTVKNAKNGTRFLWANHLNGGSSTSYNSGRIEVIQGLTVKASDSDGNNIEGAKFYIADNPELAVADNTTNTLDFFNNETAQTQRIYEETTDSNGETATFEVLTGEGKSGSGDPINGKIRSRGKNPVSFYFNQPETDDVFDYTFISYKHKIINSETILRGLDEVRINVIFTDDLNITQIDKSIVDNYTGIAINHTIGSESITISEDTDLCKLYDFAKANKLDNIQFPTQGSKAVNALTNDLDIGDYQLIITGNAVLSPCEKFTKVLSSKTSLFNDIDVNLRTGLTDATGTYKLIQLSNLIAGNIVMTNEVTGDVITQESDFTGTINLVTQSNSTDVSVVVNRDGYSNWAVSIDLTSSDRFLLQVNQSVAVPNALLSKQEELLFLLRKVLQKNQAIQSALNNEAVPALNLDAVLQNVEFASDKKQDEMIAILRRILTKTQAIRTATDH